MLYVAILRALRVLKWYAIVLVVLQLPVVYAMFKSGPSKHAAAVTSDGRALVIPLEALVFGALFGALIVAMFLASGLDAEYKTMAIAWTRPIGRLAIAARYLMVAVVALAVAWALTFAAEIIPVAAAGLLHTVGFTGLVDSGGFALAAGCIVLWYGLIVLAAAAFPGRGGAIAGMSWGVFLVLTILGSAHFPPELHALMVALNFINPFAYLGNINGDGADSSVLNLSGNVRLVLVWAIGLATTYAGIRVWARREVPG